VSLVPGLRFGPYEVLSRLGAGGMGEVWRARDERLEREVALKVLPASAVSDETARARLLREARMAARLNHPGICTIHEVGEAEGETYIAMELVEGQPLSERLVAGRMRMEDVLRLGNQMADALAHAHAHGVVHRDFKSANVIVTPEGRAKVLDFGLAKPLVGEDLDAATTMSQGSLTEAGAIVGTLPYMAPEQLHGRTADARSDVWALGVVLYEMVAGRRPFGGDTGFEVSSAILNQAPKALPADVPAALGGIIERCLAKEPSQRYQGAGEMRAALEAMQRGTAPAAWPGWRATVVAHRWPVLMGVVSSVLIVLAGLDVGGVRSRFLGVGNGARAVRMAVLPFANLSEDPEQEYLADGLTQEMIAQLGRLHPLSLSVIARTSVMRYKNSQTPIDQIGKELGVQYVLEGSAQREGPRVRVSAELIRVDDQSQLWAEVYEREMAEWLRLQSDVARRVAQSLALKLLPPETGRLAGAPEVNPEAYDAYLKSEAVRARGGTGRQDLDIIERFLNSAIQKDPSFGKAWTGLAHVWMYRNQLGYAPPQEAVRRQREALLKAISLDEPSAYRGLAQLTTYGELDPVGAYPMWERAFELEPEGGNAGYSHILAIMGRMDEAMTRIDRKVSLDPFNVDVRSFRAIDLVFARRYDGAVAEAREALAMKPDHPVALSALFIAQVMKGMSQEALSTMKEYLKKIYVPDADVLMDEGFSAGGFEGAMRRVAGPLGELANEGKALPTDVAWLWLCAGDEGRALDWLEKAYELRDPNMPYIGVNPIYDPVRSDPRFQALLRKMGLPVAPPGTPGAEGLST
jgi:eukaryotic-like serine/threonine-protein kinase